MVEEWTKDYNLHHLNQSDRCTGKYTFHNKTGNKSAIDHVLVNDMLLEGCKGIHIDENKEQIDISDHCLVRSWFIVGQQQKTIWKRI